MIKICENCSKEFKPKQSRVRFCSKECQTKWQKSIAREMSSHTYEDREKQFKEKFELLHPGFKYHSNYVSEGTFKSECRSCGHIQERHTQCAKQSKAYRQIKCDNCKKIMTEQRKQDELKDKELLRIMREKDRMQRRQRIKKETVARRVERLEKLKGKTCEECGNIYNPLTISQKYCSVKCGDKHARRLKEINRRHQLRKNGRISWDITLDKLITRDKNTCHICRGLCDKNDHNIDSDGHFITGNNYPSIDHLLPVTKRGAHTWGNVKLAHMYCNSLKNNNEIYVNNSGQLTLAM